MKLKNIELYELPKNLYKQYKKVVLYNKNTDYETARKKLTRNIMLGKSIYYDGKQEIFLYGILKIRVNYKGDRKMITGIWNFCRPDKEWELDYELKMEIEEKIGLEWY